MAGNHSISEYVVKVASRCNLNCSYCYMYQGPDQSWRAQPRLMAEEVVRATAQRIGEHRRAGVHRPISIVLHGGEPLLFGRERFEHLAGVFRDELGEGYTLSVQTNGVLLDAGWIELFDRLGIRVGLSIDGPGPDHDRHRVDHQGRGSHSVVEANLRKLLTSEAGRRVLAGTISVIDLACAPERLYGYLRGLGVRQLGLLLPDAHFDQPPTIPAGATCSSYGEYLCRFFDAWLAEDDPGVQIGFFETAVRLVLGQGGGSDFWGLEPVQIGVVETNGSLEPVDFLRSCADGFTRLGLNVLTHPVQSLVDAQVMRPLNEPEQHLATPCRLCRWRGVCGGGALAHRFSHTNGFDNPSVYCESLKLFLSHIEHRLGLVAEAG